MLGASVGSGVMRALAAALLSVAVAACDAPWDGPQPPSGTKPIQFQVLSEQGPPARRTAVHGATSIASVRAAIVADSPNFDPCSGYGGLPDPCWTQIPDPPGHLYVAVPSAAVCYRTVKETAALSGRTLFFIYWIGKPQRTCNLALAMPHWRLLSFARSDLPSAGTLTVDMQTQEDGQSGDVTTEVELS